MPELMIPLVSHELQINNLHQMTRSITLSENSAMIEEKQYQQNHPSEKKFSQGSENVQQIVTPKRNGLDYNRESPFVKISVYKQHQMANQKIYILQDDKIIGSNQIQKNEIQIIRRKKQQHLGDNNVDLGLSSQESNVEQVPCKISTEFGFRHSSRITSQILCFLSLKYFHNRFSELPSNIFKLIHSFIKEKPKFFVQDCGTTLKTLIRIQKESPRIMNENNNYLIGADFYFHVVQLNSIPQSIENKKKDKDKESPNEYFFQTLVRENEKYRARIHGLSKEEQEQFQVHLEEYRTLKKKGRKQYHLQNCNRPFLKIQFDTPISKQIAVFIGKAGFEQTFKIGRSQDCDIIVNMNTVSRKQTQIKFNKTQWEICDGEGIRQSANGTWQSLQPYEQPILATKLKQSDPFLIEDKMEIKICENIFKFEMVGFGVSKKRKLTNTLYQELTQYN
ncbi:unnamed protein product (macronuclear) [Paramecium tetraurelia]|uniref:FHA domain-containing protein n=1 Tax=Paramecium tetraurelia TaxID=5888 RepID=A0CFA1_PARTE|nr:uncharacterized protein GSPATT00037907001 [Paramecium tetraurelia]CAK69468.1 unnamed protein product [Paramecium tetraurelia]|eukprot:XP_001436865.1 hypothetical protein (macronuclear) [Paramecium tetraurelia strain d4-2]